MLRSGRAEGDHGAAAVEFAIIVPLLVLLVFGIYEFGRAYNTQVQLTGAAREGARVMAITNDWPQAEAATIGAAPLVAAPAPTVTRVPAACSPGATMTVTATRPQTYDIPLFGSATLNLTGTGVMRCGG
jgi:Flp pilus assembly protein TadG